MLVPYVCLIATRRRKNQKAASAMRIKGSPIPKPMASLSDTDNPPDCEVIGVLSIVVVRLTAAGVEVTREE